MIGETYSEIQSKDSIVKVKKLGSKEKFPQFSSFKKSNSFRLYGGFTDHSFSFQGTGDTLGNSFRRLNPNTANYIGASMTYRWVTVFLELDIPGTKRYRNDSIPFKTQGLVINYFKRKFGGQVYFRNFSGFVLPGQDLGINKDTYRGDMKILSIGGDFYYFANHKNFSYIATSGCVEKQKGSSGSFALMSSLYYRSISGKQSFFPDSLSKFNIFGKEDGLKKISSLTLNFKPGYIHNFITKNGKYFVTPSIYAGLGLEKNSMEVKSGTISGFDPVLSFFGRIIIGYSDDQFFVYLSRSIEYNSSYYGETNITHKYNPGLICFGYRFKDRKFKNRYLKYLDLDD